MARRVVAFLVVLLLVSGAAWSQVVTLGSFQSSVSQGLFPNAVDAAFSVNGFDPVVSFNRLSHTYLFAGLTNFPKATATSFTTGAPTIGFYKAGSTRWSAFVQPLVGSSATGLSNSTAISTGAPETVVSGTTSTTYEWVDQTTETTYRFFDDTDVDLPAQFLIGLGPLNTGLFVRYKHSQNVGGAAVATWAGNNYTEVETNYTNPAGAGNVPTPTLDYSLTTTESDPDTQSEWTFRVPFYMAVGSAGIQARVRLELRSRDASSSLTEVYTPPQTALVFNSVVDELSTADRTRQLVLGVDSRLSLPLLATSHARNRLDVALFATLTSNSADPLVVRDYSSDYDFPGTGQAATITARTQQETTTTRGGSIGLSATVVGTQYLYFPLGDLGTLGFAPALTLALGKAPTTASTIFDTTKVDVVRTDGDQDGQFTTAADTVVTTTTVTTYTAHAGTFAVSTQGTLPAAIMIRPAGWPFGITLGSTLGAIGTLTSTTGDAFGTVVTTATADGTGAVASTTVTQNVTSVASSRSNMSWTFFTSQALGVTVFLPADITLDVLLNTTNLLNFDSLKVQVIVPLK